MKKYLIAASMVALTIAACKKDDRDSGSFVQTVSYPTINFTGGEFYSINTGGSLPEVAATAYDSMLGESYPVQIVGAESIDNTVPGLYVISATAKNRFGFVRNEQVFIAVTDIPDSVDLSGEYARGAAIATISRLKRGLYRTDDVGGTGGSSKTSAIFAQLNDSTLDLPEQEVEGAGTIEAVNGRVYVNATGDTTISYRFSQGGAFFNTTATRVFVKQ